MVPGLRKFIEQKIPGSRELIAIDQKIDEWKRENRLSTPLIVIDFGGFYRSLCETPQAQLDVLFGKHDRSLNTTETVLKRFRNMGVKLQFFFGGPMRYNKTPDLIYCRRQTYLDYFDRIMEMIKFEKEPEFIIQQLKEPFHNNASYFVAAMMLAEKYGQVEHSIHNECVRDIALYASKHNALAVISGNCDFALINGQWNYWDVHNFDSTKFKILHIHKSRVRDFLELNDDNLPLVGVITGKYLPANLVHNFLSRLGHKEDNFQNVAKFINKNFRNKKLNIPNAVAQFLSGYDVTKNAEIVEQSLKIFTNCPDREPVAENALSVIVKRLHNSFVYEYLNDLPIAIQPIFLCKTLYPKFMAAALQIHKRQMGVVLQHKDTKQTRIVLYYNESNFSNQPVCPVYPRLEVPPLLRIYQETADDALHKTKLKLVSWIVLDQLSYRAVENIPKPYLCAILALVNLTENQFITNEEADCILYCLYQFNVNPESMNLLKYPNSIGRRPFEVVFLYDSFHQYMVTSMNTVGLSDMVVYNQLDGVYFHQQYEEFIHMSGIERDILLEMVQSYRLYWNN